jgi:hypothetical protein
MSYYLKYININEGEWCSYLAQQVRFKLAITFTACVIIITRVIIIIIINIIIQIQISITLDIFKYINTEQLFQKNLKQRGVIARGQW